MTPSLEFESHIQLVFANKPVPPRCLIGMQEKLSIVGEHEIARTVNGRAVVLSPVYGTRYAFEVSNSGPGVLLPHQFAIGDLVTYYAQTWWTASLDHSQTQVVLPRNPLKVVARDTLSGVVLPFTRAGRQVTVQKLTAFHSATVHYRPVFDCIVADFQSSGSATGREQSWSIKLEERFA